MRPNVNSDEIYVPYVASSARNYRLIKHEHCCLMCYEADVEGCHRKIVAEKIVEMGDGVGVRDL